MSLRALFCHVDDVCPACEPTWQRRQLDAGQRRRWRASRLSTRELMTILIHFHQSRDRDCKSHYTFPVPRYLRSEFPARPCDARFVALMPRVLVPLYVYLTRCYGPGTGINFVDSTPLAVCHHRRIAGHRVFAGLAQRGKNSMGWFLGCKLHRVIHERGELRAFALTPGHGDDRKPVPGWTRALWGKLVGDKGYISQALGEARYARGLRLRTRLRSHMKPRRVPRGPRAAPTAGPRGGGPRPAQKHLPSGAYAPSESRQLPGASAVGVDGLRPPAANTVSDTGTQSPGDRFLSITHVR